jgi:hypothetical protein
LFYEYQWEFEKRDMNCRIVGMSVKVRTPATTIPWGGLLELKGFD